MDRYKVKFTRLQSEVMRLLSIKSGSSLTKRGIAKALNVSPTAIAKALPILEKESLITTEKSQDMNFSSTKLNRNSQKALNFKKIENLKLIYESNLINYLEESFPGTTIILFGSYVRGEDLENSDIDIAIIGSKEKEFKHYKLFKSLLERDLSFHFYPSISKIDKELQNNILSGIVLVGGISL